MKADYEETQQTWNKIADLYASKFMHLDLYDPSYRFFCDLFSNETAEILEIGCGPGNIAKFILREYPGLNVTGIDSSENMVELAKMNNPKGNFQVMDARNIGQFKTRFDGIICGFCLPYLNGEDGEMLFKNSFDLLAENGHFYVSFVAGDAHLSGFQTGSSGDRIYFYFYPLETIRKWLNLSGFSEVEKFEVPYQKADGSSEIHTILIAQKK
jgi:SAM-dependent methyltransferase